MTRITTMLGGAIRSVALAALMVLPLPGCGDGDSTASSTPETVEGPEWFEEVAARAGLDFVHQRGPTTRYDFPEIIGGGAAWLDYDDDGWLDLYLVQSGDLRSETPDALDNRLYRNVGDGSFRDVTDSAGVGDTGYGMGCAVGDYDGDGHVDLYVTNYGPNVLYRNNGDGTFTDVTAESGTGDSSWGTSAAFQDFDRDGDLDLFVANYVAWSPEIDLRCTSGTGDRDYCKPTNYNQPAPDVLYRNEGDGTFIDVTEAAGIIRAFGNGLGVACGDFDRDGWVDLYVANDGMPNQLWINQRDGTFVDRAMLAGCAVNLQGMAEAGMGVAAVDVEPDGDLDLFMTHLRDESNTFYVNQEGIFEDTTAVLGLSAPSIRYTGFGIGFADFDHDGLTDIYVANGRVGTWDPAPSPDDPYAEPNLLFRGTEQGRFEAVRPAGGCAGCPMENSRAAAFADYDEDGDVDVVVVNNHGPVRLLRNDAGGARHWVGFRVLDQRGRDALGAAVRIDAGERAQWRQVQRAYSYCASNDPRVHFGLGELSAVDRVTVRWPDGREEAFGTVEVDARYELQRGTGRVKKIR
jgi:hypothetical protein